MKKLFSILIVILLTCSFVDSEIMAATIKLNKSSIDLEQGDTYILKLSGVTSGIKWSCKNKDIVSVSAKGKITAKKSGTTLVTASYNGSKYTCNVTVEKKFHNDLYQYYDDLVGNEVKLNDGYIVSIQEADGNSVYMPSTVSLFYDSELMCAVEGFRTVDPIGKKRYLIIDFSIMNLSEDDFYVSDSFFSLLDSNTYSYAPERYLLNNNFAPSGNINAKIKPGDIARGEIAFIVPYNSNYIYELKCDIPGDIIGRLQYSIDLSNAVNQDGLNSSTISY